MPASPQTEAAEPAAEASAGMPARPAPVRLLRGEAAAVETRPGGGRRLSLLGAPGGPAPAGPLYGWHDETLAPGAAAGLRARHAGYWLALPVTGALQVGVGPKTRPLEVGQVGLWPVAAGVEVSWRPLDPAGETRLVHGWLADPAARPGPGQVEEFTLDQLTDGLGCLLAAGPLGVRLGRFGGRGEARHLAPAGTALWGYALAGAFEVAERLLHAGDGLSLPAGALAGGVLELEALSEGALLLVLELPGALGC